MSSSTRIILYSARDPNATRLKQLTNHWPGAASTQNSADAFKNAIAAGSGDLVVVEDAQALASLVTVADEGLSLSLAEVEKRHLLRVLAAHGGNKTRAARSLGIDTKTLYNKLKSYSRDSAQVHKRANVG